MNNYFKAALVFLCVFALYLSAEENKSESVISTIKNLNVESLESQLIAKIDQYNAKLDELMISMKADNPSAEDIEKMEKYSKKINKYYQKLQLLVSLKSNLDEETRAEFAKTIDSYKEKIQKINSDVDTIVNSVE